MATILTPAEVKAWTPITASIADIEQRKLIEVVENRIPITLNNYFVSEEIYIKTTAVFNATARSITIDQNSWSEFGFQAGDNMMIYGSYRNDQFCTIESITDNVAVLTSSYSVVNESFNNNLGRVIYFGLLSWPIEVKMVAAEMVYYDFDIRKKNSPNIKSRSLGPLSETYTDNSGSFGYPSELWAKLDKYNLAILS